MNSFPWSSCSSFFHRIAAGSRLVVVFFATALALAAQSEVTWDFSTATPSGIVPALADIAVGAITQNNNNGTTTMITAASVSSGYAGASGTSNAGAAARPGALVKATGGSAYFEVTFTPVAGKQVVLSALTFGSRSTSTGPAMFSVFASIDGYTTPLATGVLTANSAWALQSPALAGGGVTGVVGTAVTLRIYGHGGSGSASAGTANWRIDDLAFTTSASGGGGVPVVPTVLATTPVNGAAGIAANVPVVVTFNQPVTTSGAWFVLSGATSGAMPATVSGGPIAFTLTPSTTLAAGEAVTLTVMGAQVVEQAFGTLAMAGNLVVSFTVAPAISLKRVHEVQGSGAASPLAGQVVMLDAVVTGFVTSSTGRDGFYVQEEDAETDGNPATSEGVYVFAPGNSTAAALVPGDRVALTGTVAEFNGLTEITTLTHLAKLGTGPLPAAVTIALPAASATAFEAYEGMRVTFAQTLTVSGTQGLGQYGELVLSGGGRLLQPTNFIDPNDAPASGTSTNGTSNVAAVTAQQTANNLNSLVLDDASTRSYPDPTPHLNASSTRRAGDTVTGLTGVLGYRFNFFRIDPQAPVDFTDANPRPLALPAVGAATLRVGSANVLNFFLTLGDSGRGADNAPELARQRAKILAELSALNADIFGLMEVERRADNSALADIVAGLNGILGAGTYAYVDSSAIAGTDAIQVALIYKPGAVAPVGSPKIDTSPGASVHNRPPLAQTFAVAANGEKFTVVVNHFKSKGSGTGVDADQGDGQAASNALRKRQAAQLAGFLADPVARFGDPDVLIIGDLNSYAEEDPIDILRTAGFANQLERFHPEGTYSYVFDNQAGYLDHALANASLAAQITGAAEWHVNADEPSFYDYNTENKSAAQQAINTGTPYRASDHDPVIVGLRLAPPAPQGFAAWIAQYGIPAGQDGPADDYDGDGGSNLFEYGVGTRPDVAGTSGRPTLTREGAALVFRFSRSPGLTDVSYAVMVSADLVIWSSSPVAPLVETVTLTTETLAIVLPLNEGRQFAKLVVSQP